MKNYKATKEFIDEVRHCHYSGKELMNMMEKRFKEYDKAGYPENLKKFKELNKKMGKDKYGNILFGCVLAEIPIHINSRWMNNSILAHNDKEWYESHYFLTRVFPEINPGDYKKVHNLFDEFCKTMNEPIQMVA